MAEVGCLKDGLFQNLQSQQIMLGTNSLVSPVVHSGKIILDAITNGAAGAGDESNITLGAENLNTIIFLKGVIATTARVITLPALSVANIGDRIVIYLLADASTTFTIDGAGDDEILGTLNLTQSANSTFTSAQNPPNLILPVIAGEADSDKGIVLGTGVGKANAGTMVSLTCVGGSSITMTQNETAGGTEAVQTTGTQKIWLIEGNAACDSANPTGADIIA